jgi:chitosanase
VNRPAAPDAVVREKAFRLTSTAENSTVDWWEQYGYIEDIRDGRGYTGGLVGFTSATGDMLDLVEDYAARRPEDTALAGFPPGLRACAELGDTVDEAEYGVSGGRASDLAAAELGPGFLAAWATAARNDGVFRECQRDHRDQRYWRPALRAAEADGVGPLGVALYYDTSVNHGHDPDLSTYGTFDWIRAHAAGAPPSRNGDEVAWLAGWLHTRAEVLDAWGDNPSDGRISLFRRLVDVGDLDLAAPIEWSVYGDAFVMAAEPAPRAD